MAEVIEVAMVEEVYTKDPKLNPSWLSKVGIPIAREAIQEGDLATLVEEGLVDQEEGPMLPQ